MARASGATTARFWVAMSAGVLAAAYATTATGMTGRWDVQVLGVKHGAIWDPGGPYLGSALLLAHERYAPFVGHPGLTLTLLCRAIARALHLVIGGSAGFDDFAARHLHAITFASMMAMAALHLWSMAVVARMARKLLGDDHLAMLAALSYGTTFPVLYYLNKVSPEPLLVIFTLLAFIWLWRYYEEPERPRALLFLVLSAQASVAAVYTKFMIVGPILVFIPFQVLVCGAPFRRRRAADAALFVASCLPGLLLGALKTDWAYFFTFWFAYAPGAPQYSMSSTWLVNVVVNAPATALAMLGSALVQVVPWRLVPSLHTREGLFFAAENLFLILSLAGAAMYLRARRTRPVLLLWFLAFVGLTTLPWLQRGVTGWHYLFVQFAVGSVFVSYALARLARRFGGIDATTIRGWAVCCSGALVVNSVGICLFVDKARFDATQYPAWGLYYQAPALVAPGGRVGLLRAEAIDEIMQPFSSYLPNAGFLEKCRDLLVPISGDEPVSELHERRIDAIVELKGNRLDFRRVRP